MRKPPLSIVILALVAAAFVWSQVSVALRQADIQKAVRANCDVLSVLLINRADRDETLKLFEPIRQQNPEQFDKLVKRAEDGDKRLVAVQGDLACDVTKKE